MPFDFSPTVWWLPAETEMMFAQFEILHCPYVLYPTAEQRPLENTTAEWSPPAEIVDVVLRSAFMTAPTRRLIANVSMPVVLRNVEETGVEPDCLNASLSVGDGSTAIVPAGGTATIGATLEDNYTWQRWVHTIGGELYSEEFYEYLETFESVRSLS